MTKHALTISAILVALLPALAYAQPDLDATHVGQAVDAFTIGGGAAAGLVASLAVAVYRKRKQLAALDTWQEVRALLAFLVPIALAAYAAIPDALAPAHRVGAALLVAILTALGGNTGPLGGEP